jgi:hypothetical protein
VETESWPTHEGTARRGTRCDSKAPPRSSAHRRAASVSRPLGRGVARGFRIGRGVALVAQTHFGRESRRDTKQPEGGSKCRRLKEAWEWLDRAEQARKVAGQLTDPAREKRSWSLPKASIGSPEPPLPRLCSGDGSWRRKTTNETGDFSRAFLNQTAAAPPDIEKNGSAQRDANSRGASPDHGASKLADRPLC